jgi:hypothetical protein
MIVDLIVQGGLSSQVRATGEIGEEMDRSLIADIDLWQAASHTFKES